MKTRRFFHFAVLWAVLLALSAALLFAGEKQGNDGGGGSDSDIEYTDYA